MSVEPTLVNRSQARVLPLFNILSLQTKLSHRYEAIDVAQTDERWEHTRCSHVEKNTFVIIAASIS